MKKGFTLIELMIVVSVVGILAAMAIPSYFRAETQNKLNGLGLKCSGLPESPDAIYYNPDTKLVVEINSDKTKIKRTIGKITVPLTIFENLDTGKQREAIEYFPSKPISDDAQATITSNSLDTITINGIKYIKAEQ